MLASGKECLMAAPIWYLRWPIFTALISLKFKSSWASPLELLKGRWWTSSTPICLTLSFVIQPGPSDLYQTYFHGWLSLFFLPCIVDRSKNKQAAAQQTSQIKRVVSGADVLRISHRDDLWRDDFGSWNRPGPGVSYWLHQLTTRRNLRWWSASKCGLDTGVTKANFR